MNKKNLVIWPVLVGIIVFVSTVNKKLKNDIKRVQEISDKHFLLFIMMNQWVKIKQEGKNLATYLQSKEYKNIAIYGMSYVGETLVKELRNTDVHVLYGIDKNARTICTDIDVVTVDEKFAPVDVILVTAISFFDEIREELSKKVKCPVISLEDVLYEI